MQKRASSKGKLKILIAFLSVSMVIYHVLYAKLMFIGPIEHQSIHLLFVLVIAFLSTLYKKRGHWPIIGVMLALSVFATGYVAIMYPELQNRIGLNTTLDLYVGAILIIVVFVALIYLVGVVLPILGGICIAYTFYGNLLPDPLWHFPISFSTAIPSYNIGFSGMYGLFLGISANYIFLFIVFGVFLEVSGGGRFFIEIGKLLSNRLAGGAGHTALISSSMVGMLMGHGASSVVTAPFTIPLMTRAGYSSEQAAAVESVSSALGSVMPPVMGITAFVMSQYLGIPYIKICLMALIPALLKIFCIGIYVQLFAMKKGIIPEHGSIEGRTLVVYGPMFIFPLTSIILLLMLGYSLIAVSFVALVGSFGLAMLRKETRASLGRWVEACIVGARIGANVGLTCAVIGVIVASINMTGLGLKLPDVVLELSGNILIIALALTMLMEIVLGMGVPPLIGYIVGVVLVGPALAGMGVSEIQAHFFILYASVSALITPPVAVSCIVPAAIARTSYLRVAFYSTWVGMVAFLLPFMVIYVPGLILQHESLLNFFLGVFSCFMFILLLQAGLLGYLVAPLKRSMALLTFTATLAFGYYIITRSFIALVAAIVICFLIGISQLRSKARIRAGDVSYNVGR